MMDMVIAMETIITKCCLVVLLVITMVGFITTFMVVAIVIDCIVIDYSYIAIGLTADAIAATGLGLESASTKQA